MTYEYCRVPWDQISDRAAQGWRIVPMPPVAEMKNVLGQMQMGEPLYAMERAADPARAERLREHALAGQRINNPDGLIVPPGR